ncbi:menaquinone biosynthesis family protein [Rubrolithibacter danxiaensis]|uniref:menaquinone biosynthesis family protein n=1 Tax=Rubrolithibacter danxiaensis TaxID=3390805 RepID=UPI003BF7B500
MKLTLGFSPCPNDTFIFDALIHHKIDTEGLEFEVLFEDVETLNQKAFNAELDITKLSFHAFAYVVKNYVLLDSGSALGFGVGPLLIAKEDYSSPGYQDLKSRISNLKTGIPGKYTTANFLFSLAYPEAKNKVEVLFSNIEDRLLNGDIDLGLIIHENRFTYQQKGLHKIIDLGEFWENLTECAIPLGGIVINRKLPDEVKQKVNRLVRKSVEFAFQHPQSAIDFIRSHAQAMEEEVMYKHIELYVNNYSVELGDEGRKAIKILFDTALEKGIIPNIEEDLFLK